MDRQGAKNMENNLAGLIAITEGGGATAIKAFLNVVNKREIRKDAKRMYDLGLFSILQVVVRLSPPEETSVVSECLLAILVALRTHPNHEKMKLEAFGALCSLIVYPKVMGKASLQYAATATLIGTMDQDPKIAAILLETIVGSSPTDTNIDRKGGHFRRLIAAGFTRVLTRFMELPVHIGNQEFQLLAARYLYLAIGDGEKEENLVAAISPALSACNTFSSSDLPVAHQCCTFLFQLMDSFPDSVSKVRNAGGPQRVLSMLKQEASDIGLQSECILILNFFATDEMAQHDYFAAVLAVLKKQAQSVSVRQAALPFLENMVNQKSGALLFLESGAVSYLFGMMRSHPSLKEFHLLGTTLVKCLSRWDETREAVLTDEAVSLVTCAMKGVKHFKYKDFLFVRCMEALQHLLEKGDTHSMVDAIAKEGGAEAITKAILSLTRENDVRMMPTSFLAECCCDLLQKVATHGEEAKLAIAKEGGVGFVLQLMKSRLGDREIQREGCKLLGVLTAAMHPLIFDSISKEDGVNIILDAMMTFETDKIVFNCGGHAALLTREFENEKARISRSQQS